MTDQPSQDPADETMSASGTLRRLDGDDCCEGIFPHNRRADEETVANTVPVFKALANEHRIKIIEALRDGELCACELQTVLDAPQSTVGSHLATLREAGIVRTRKEGKWTYYRIADTASLQLVDLADSLGEST